MENKFENMYTHGYLTFIWFVALSTSDNKILSCMLFWICDACDPD